MKGMCRGMCFGMLVVACRAPGSTSPALVGVICGIIALLAYWGWHNRYDL